MREKYIEEERRKMKEMPEKEDEGNKKDDLNVLEGMTSERYNPFKTKKPNSSCS